MTATPIYMDNHATTRVDPRVIEAMVPLLGEVYGNAGSTTHALGWAAKDLVDAARQSVAAAIGARAKEIVFTSGATESNNLAIRGLAESRRRRGNHVVSVATEHPSVLDPLEKLGRKGFEITLLPVRPAPHEEAGLIDPEQVAGAIRDDTFLVSVMLANNEIGAIQPLDQIGRICRQRGVALHTDATQAVGKMPLDVERLGVDLLSFSAHKIYGPKGVGALYVRRKPRGHLEPQIDGGGQEGGLRSGTLNTAGIVAMAKALELCLEEMADEAPRLRRLRDRLFAGLTDRLPDVVLNGPALLRPELRLPGNLNVSFKNIDGEALLMSVKEVAVSSGSACSAANPEPSHVIRALGTPEDLTRGSVRFGLGRFNTDDDVTVAVEAFSSAVGRLRRMSSLA